MDHYPVNQLNLRFLNVQTEDHEMMKSKKEEEIQELTQQLFRKRQEYIDMIIGKLTFFTEDMCGEIEERLPMLKGYNWLKVNPGGGIDVILQNFHINMNRSERIFYQTLPLYSFNVTIPMEGPILFKNQTIMGHIDGITPFAVNSNSAFGHPHADTRSHTFSHVCSGNNPFKDMYYGGKINEPKDISKFLINLIEWVRTTNVSDMWHKANYYKKLEGNLYVDVEQVSKYMNILNEASNTSDALENLEQALDKNRNHTDSYHACITTAFENLDNSAIEEHVTFYLMQKLFLAMLLITTNNADVVINAAKWDIYKIVSGDAFDIGINRDYEVELFNNQKNTINEFIKVCNFQNTLKEVKNV